jgi:hypothetical protein
MTHYRGPSQRREGRLILTRAPRSVSKVANGFVDSGGLTPGVGVVRVESGHGSGCLVLLDGSADGFLVGGHIRPGLDEVRSA